MSDNSSEIIGKKGGKGGGSSGGSESKNTLQSQATARLVEVISHGECVGLANTTRPLRSIYLDGVPVENPDGSYNYKGLMAQQNTGTPSQLPFVGFPSIEAVNAIGLQITTTTPRIYSVTSSNVDAVRVTVQIDALAKQDDKGNLVGNTVSYQIERRIAAGSWSVVTKVTLNEKCTSAQQLSYRIERPAAADVDTDWDVRVVRLTADPVKVSDQSSITLAIVTELTDAKISYADMAAIAMTVDSKQFGNSIPTRSYDWVGMILDVPSNYTAPDYNNPNDQAKRVYTGLWDGTFKRAWTDNPAWILWAFLTDKDWGLGRNISPDQIDKWTLYRIAQYCDEFVPDGEGGYEPRYTVNTQITSAEEAYSVLQSIASIFHGGIYWSSGMVTFTCDMPEDPAKLVTKANVINGEFTYQGSALKTRHSVVKVTWNDPSDQYRAAIEVVEDPDTMDRFGWRVLDVIAYGCTSRGQAHRMGRWILDTERYQTETVTYQASLDHADLRPGSIVEIYDPSYAGVRFAGRLSNITGTSATLDDTVTLESGKTYTITLVRPDGTLTTRAITDSAGATTTVHWSSSLIEQPAVGSTVNILQTSIPTQRGHIKSVTSTSVTLNEFLIVDPAYTYTIYFNLPDGSTANRVITPPGTGEFHTFSWSGALTTLPAAGSVVYLGIAANGYTSRTVSARTTTSVTLNSSITLDDDHSYEVALTLPSGTLITRRVTNSPGSTTVLNWAADEALDQLPITGSLWGITASDLAPRQFRVVGVREAEANVYEVTGVLHDPNKYDRIELGLSLDAAQTSIYQSEAVPDAPTNIDAYRVSTVAADGVPGERVMVTWTPSTSTLVNRYKLRYLYENQWYDLGETYSNNVDFPSQGAGTYFIQVIAVNFMNHESVPLEQTFSLDDIRPYSGVIVNHIRIEGSTDVSQPTQVQFTGSDLKIQWNSLPPADWTNTSLTDWEDPYLKRYRVRLKTTADVVVGTFYTTERRFVLTKEMNLESNGGTPLRDFKIGIAFEDNYGTTYTESVQEFVNPAPAAPTIAVNATAKGFTLDVSKCTASDYGGTKIWVSTTSGFDPTVVSPVVDAPQTSFTVAATTGTTYYVRAAHYDDYTTSPSLLSISPQYSIAVPTLGSVDIGVGVVGSDNLNTGESVNVPTGLGVSSSLTYDTDGTQIILLTASWTASTGSNVSYYEISITPSGGAAIIIPVTGTSYSMVAKANFAYDVKVRAVSFTGARSSWTSIVNHTTTHDTTAPALPTGLAVTASLTALYLSWVNPSDVDLDHVELWENTTNVAGGTKLATISATPGAAGSWTRAGLSGGTTRYYALKSVDTSGNTSAFTAVVSGTVSTLTFDYIDSTPPAVPTGLALSSALTLDTDGTQIITLTATWSAVGDADLSFYEVALQEAAGAFVQYNVGQGTSFTWSVKANTSYTAKIRSVDETQNRSAFSTTVNHTTTRDTTAPSAPTSPAAVAAFNSIFLSWTNPTASDLALVEVWENTSNATGGTKIATVLAQSASAGSYTRTGLVTGTLRYYSFRAVDSSGNTSGYSTVVSATTASLVGTDFATGLQPVSYGDYGAAGVSLPSTGNYEGRLAFNTNSLDRKLYRYAGGVWTKAVDGADISAGTITANSIATGTITAAQIATGTITTTKLAVGDFSNMCPDPDIFDFVSGGSEVNGQWWSATATRVTSASLTIPTASIYALTLPVAANSGSAKGPLFTVEPGKEYWTSAYLYPGIGTTGDIGVGVQWYDKTVGGSPVGVSYFAGLSTSTTYSDITAIPNITVTRASGGYARDIAGNLVWFGNDTARRTDYGLLIETASSNLQGASEDFTNVGAWGGRTSGLTVVGDAAMAPNGTLTGDQLIEDTSSGAHTIGRGFNATTSTSYMTISVFVKANGRTKIALAPNGGAAYWNGNATFDLAAETATLGAGFACNIEKFANGWYRCSVTAQATGTSATSCSIYLVNGATSSYVGDGVSGVYAWGWQLEEREFASSYIPSPSGSTARAADQIKQDSAGFTSWWNPAEGTIFTEVISLQYGDINAGTTSSPFRCTAGFGTGLTNQIVIGGNDQTTRVYRALIYMRDTATIAGGIESAGNNVYVPGVVTRHVFGFKPTNHGLAVNGALIGTSTGDGSGLNITQVFFGASYSGFSQLNGYLRRFIYVPRRLSDTDLVVASAGVLSPEAGAFYLDFMTNSYGLYGAAPNLSAGRYTGRVTAPANATAGRFFVFRGITGTQSITVTEPFVRKASVGQMIVDGAITTQHITVNTLNGDRLLAGSVYANKLFVSGNSTQDALPTGITVGVSGTTIGTVDTRASDPITRANTQSTQLLPGLVQISGSTTLANWRNGTDNTKIEGGSIAANTIAANAVTIGLRGITIAGLEFQHNWNGTVTTTNTLYWSAGTIGYVNDSGTATTAAISSGTIAWTTGTVWVYWVKGGTTLSTTTTQSTAYGANNIVLATYRGGTDLVANYGRTIIDGSKITTGSITTNQIAAGAIKADQILTGTLGGNNLILNPGAETAGTEGWIHENVTGTTTLAASTADKYAGDYAFRITKNATSDTCRSVARAVAISPNKTYTVRVAVKGSSATASGLYVRVNERSSFPTGGYVTTSLVTTQKDLSTNVATPSSWTLYEFTYTPTAGTQWASLTVINWTNGPTTLYFDETQLAEQASAVTIKDGAVTATKISVANLAAISADVGMINASGLTVNNGSGTGEPIFQALGGDVSINSARIKSLNVGAVITVGSGSGIKVALQSFQVTAKDGDVLTWPVDLGNVPTYIQPIPTNTLAALSGTEVRYDCYLENLTSTGATVRLKKVTAATATSYAYPTSGTGTNVSGRWEIAKTVTPSSTSGTYKYRVKGTHGYVLANPGKSGPPEVYKGIDLKSWFYDSSTWTAGPTYTISGTDPASPSANTMYVVSYDVTYDVSWSTPLSSSAKFGVQIDPDSALNQFFNGGSNDPTPGTNENTISEFTKVTWNGPDTPPTANTASPNNETTVITIIPQNI